MCVWRRVAELMVETFPFSFVIPKSRGMGEVQHAVQDLWGLNLSSTDLSEVTQGH